MRQLWVAPIRHHSPACAAHLERLIEEVAPAAILVEGPCDFDPLIDLVCDPRTRAPVAVVSLRETAGAAGAPRRAASYFPFCAHSPELIALNAARARGVPVRFIDLPSDAREMDLDGEPHEGRSLLSSELPFDVGDYVTALARELGCRDGNEVWDHLFETRIAEADWRGFFGDVARYCAAIRAATEAARMASDGTLAREAQMRALLAQVRSEVAGPIVAVVGGFHAEALLDADAAAGQPVAPQPGAARSYLMRYGMRQLDALRGYGAGLPLPGYYQRLWNARGQGGASGLAQEIVTGFAAHLRAGKGGQAPSLPVIVNAIEQAERLAMLRGRPFPMRDDVIDAIRSSFVKDEMPKRHAPLLDEFAAWLTGTAIGEVPPSAGSPPLVEAVRGRAGALGFAVDDGERRSRELDIYRKPRHRAASRLCHALVLLGTPFAERTGGPDFRNDVSLDRLHEVWRTGWSPLVEARLIALSEMADDLDEALAFVLAQKVAALADAGRGRNALAAINLFAAACRAGLGGGAGAVLPLIEEQVIEDPEPASVIAALADLLLLRRGREVVGIEEAMASPGGPLDRLVATVWRRVLLLLPDMADLGEDRVADAVKALADLRGAIELARSSAAPIDLALFDEALDGLAARALPPMLAGAVMAFSLIDGRVTIAALEARLRGELAGGYVDPAERLAFLGGLIAIARELIWTVPAIVGAIDSIVTGLDEDTFLALLPHLRMALLPLDPREVDRLAEDVAARLGTGAGALAVAVAISEGELAENLRLDGELARVLAAEGMA
ncbi:DUF5682 family protein [Novosphingobium resinovorum]|uniref:DUF5682 family protein n=1 Tax=Novosphingobium resinovorum TaxID=158500 RepID=UPI002ED393EA|nr:DUF5682 family protein [Novosphingobium resinovorum]